MLGVFALSLRIVMSSIMRRRNGLTALSVMEVLLSWERLLQPLDLKTGRFRSIRLLIITWAAPEAPYRASGLVH